MRFTFAAAVFSAVVSTTSAAHLLARQSFPSCADSCVLTPANTFGCAATDDTCLCNSQQYIAATTACILAACDASDAESAESLSQQLCLQVGVTLTSTPSIPSTSGGASSTSSSVSVTQSSGASTTGSSSGSAPSSTTTSPTSSGSSGAATSSSSGAPAASSSSAAMATGTNAFVGLAALFLAVLNF